jgi:hypothetical protein
MVKDLLVGNVPKTTVKQSILILIMNIIIPGSGTILLGIISDPRNDNLIKTGVLQFISAIFVVGWIWSIWWGIELVKKAKDDAVEDIERKKENLIEPVKKVEREYEHTKDQAEAHKAEVDTEKNQV